MRSTRPRTSTKRRHEDHLNLLCPLRIGPLEAGIPGILSPAGEGAETDEGEQFFGRARQAFILKQAEEGVPIGDVCRKAGISQATFYAWRKKYAGLLPSEMRRLKALEDENARLKKLVAELSLDREMLQDVVRRKL